MTEQMTSLELQTSASRSVI